MPHGAVCLSFMSFVSFSFIVRVICMLPGFFPTQQAPGRAGFVFSFTIVSLMPAPHQDKVNAH